MGRKTSRRIKPKQLVEPSREFWTKEPDKEGNYYFQAEEIIDELKIFCENHSAEDLVTYLFGLYKLLIREATRKKIVGQILTRENLDNPLFGTKKTIYFDFEKRRPQEGVIFLEMKEEPVNA